MHLLPIAFLTVASAQAAANESPRQIAPLWQGVRDITIRCEGEGSDRCARFATLAAAVAPFPVTDDAGQLSPATLIIHAVFGRDTAGRAQVALSAERAASFDDAQGMLVPRHFTARPGEDDDALIGRALNRFLPWRTTRRPGRTIRFATGKGLK
ncbi:hypothetical protein [Sphingomonas sp. IW22]|uniref:hypothetical protein n=1 Tax=Sphingomonas sp. IW22 TaxID=3242489 RepID=UPI0035225DA2